MGRKPQLRNKKQQGKNKQTEQTLTKQENLDKTTTKVRTSKQTEHFPLSFGPYFALFFVERLVTHRKAFLQPPAFTQSCDETGWEKDF